MDEGELLKLPRWEPGTGGADLNRNAGAEKSGREGREGRPGPHLKV